MNLSNLLAKRSVIFFFSFFLFMSSYKINEQFDSFALYTTGISLVFIPAGIKLLCLLVGGEAAAMGLLLSSLYVSTRIWNLDLSISILYSAVASVGSYYLSVLYIKKALGINENLSNLRYFHIIILSAVASIAHGILLNAIYVWQDKFGSADLLSNAAAMILGDFIGCFIVIVFINICIDVTFALMHRKRRN